MTRHPTSTAVKAGMPHDLCFMRRVKTAFSGDLAWQFRCEGDLARVSASTYTLFFSIADREWSGDANLMQTRSFELSQMQVDVLRNLLPPAEVAHAMAASINRQGDPP